MRTFSLALIILLIIPIGISAQGQLTSAAIKKAGKKASAEAKMYRSKGFSAYKSNLSIENLLRDYYEQSFKEVSPGNRLYISSQSIARANSAAAAIQNATLQAKKRIAGLLQMYFNSWISVDKRTSEKEKSDLMKAVNQSEKALEIMLKSQKPDKLYRLLKEKSGKYQAVVRVLYNQQNLRVLARKEIVKTAGPLTNVSENTIINYLRFQ